MIRDLLLIPVVITHEVSEWLIEKLLPVEELHPTHVPTRDIEHWVDDHYA